MGAPRQVVTIERILSARRMVGNGESLSSIGKKLGISKQAVSALLKTVVETTWVRREVEMLELAKRAIDDEISWLNHLQREASR